MLKKLAAFLFLFIFIYPVTSIAQNVGIGTNEPKAALDVTSTTNGFLPPRMTYQQRKDIVNPAVGLMVYCTDCGAKGEWQGYNGSDWTTLTGSSTQAALPVLNTISVASIAQTTATSGGNIYSDGGAAVLSRGLVWSTSENPTILLSTKTSDGVGLGNFISSITGLTASTTYYIRAYATNSVGTAYGNEVSFTTTVTLPPSNNVTDIDGNTYPIVTICDQNWMSTNLNVSRYSDGTIIPQAQNSADWENITTGAWCYFRDNTANGIVYGKLYNWFAAAGIYDAASLSDPSLRKKLAPQGWHVPSDLEWTTLINCLDPNANGGLYRPNTAGGKMKSTGTQYWLNINQDATNSSGFSGLPGGYRANNGSFSNPAGGEVIGNWWSSTIANNVSSWQRLLYNDSGNAYKYIQNKNYGLSVRCVKD